MSYSFKTSGWPERLWRTNNDADIARGNVPGSVPFSAYGEMVVAGAGTSLIWETGMPTTLTVPNSIQLTLVSTSSLDNQNIAIKYLDGDLLERTETVTLNGLTPVTTVATDIRAINNAYSKDGLVTGSISFTNGGVTYATIRPNDIQFHSSIQRVPANKRMMVHSLFAGSASGSSDSRVTVRFVTSFFNGDSFAQNGYLHTVAGISIQDSSSVLSGFGPFPIPAGEWVGLRAQWDKAADITAGYFGYLEDA